MLSALTSDANAVTMTNWCPAAADALAQLGGFAVFTCYTLYAAASRLRGVCRWAAIFQVVAYAPFGVVVYLLGCTALAIVARV